MNVFSTRRIANVPAREDTNFKTPLAMKTKALLQMKVIALAGCGLDRRNRGEQWRISYPGTQYLFPNEV